MELTLYWVCYPLVLGSFALNLGLAADPLAKQAALTSFTTWAPLVYIWAYIVFGSKRGLLGSFRFLVATLLVLITAAFAEWRVHQAATSLSFLGEFGFAGICYIVALFGFASFLERQTGARVTAETVAEFAYTDILTGLPNRLALQTRLEHAVALAKRNHERLAVCFIDLDGFKRINDTYGHQGGDKLLQQFAQRLRGSVRESDTVARMSGDEFVVVAFIREAEQARTLAEKLLGVYHAPFLLEGAGVTVTGSIGISLYPDDGEESDTLLLYADSAMYEAKAAGKNRWAFYSPAKAPLLAEGLDLTNPLRRAVERRELDVHYQPLYDLKSRTLVGVEALARWYHPELGEVPPCVFIPLAERNQLIAPLGTWVLETACRQAKSWQAAGLPPVRVNVNISAGQFAGPDFASIVKDVLHETGLAPEWLGLELTESSVIQPSAASQLEELRALGVRVSLDDFGTGYSSLAQLQRLPIDGFKIDRSFLSALQSPRGATKNAMVLLEVIVKLASGLGLTIVAEGVETEEQEALLRATGCDVAQGFLFAKPAAASDIAKLLSTAPRAVPEYGATLQRSGG